jgi:hypothetical protein
MKRAKKVAKKKPTGRPSKRTPAVIAKILAGLSEGTPLTLICSPKNMPSDNTVRNWMRDDEQLSDDIARAREAGFDRIALDALAIADNSEQDTILTDKGAETPNSEWIARSRLRVETRLKLLAKWDPKRYGDRIAQEITGADGGPVATMAVQLTPDQDAALRRVIEDAQERVRRV